VNPFAASSILKQFECEEDEEECDCAKCNDFSIVNLEKDDEFFEDYVDIMIAEYSLTGYISNNEHNSIFTIGFGKFPTKIFNNMPKL
jgi:hypothetical protein